MAKSTSLPSADARVMLRLVAEAGAASADAASLHRRLLEGFTRLVGAKLGVACLFRFQPGSVPLSNIVRVGHVEPHELPILERYEQDMDGDPAVEAVRRIPGRLVTRRRRDLVSDEVWYRSRHFVEYRQPAGIDDLLCSILRPDARSTSTVIAINRALGDRPFTRRHCRMLHLLHSSIPLWQELTALPARPTPSGMILASLPPRLREVLAGLQQGKTAKALAADLGISVWTAEEHIQRLYRRLGVRTRAELLSRFIGRPA